MADSKLTVAVAKAVAEQVSESVVVVVAVDVANNMTHVATYGKSPLDKHLAAKLGEIAVASYVDLSKTKMHEDFHDDPVDCDVQFGGGSAVLKFPVRMKGIGAGDLAARVAAEDFISSSRLVDNDHMEVSVRANSVAELQRLLPAYKARLREVLIGSSV